MYIILKIKPEVGIMNILDKKFEEFRKQDTEERIKCFSPKGRPFDMIMSQQLNRKVIDELYDITNSLRHISKSRAGSLFLRDRLSHKRAMLYFAQPSSRTFLSFENACHILGMRTSEIRDTSVSSEVKGESFDDSLRTFSSYTDLVIMRHSEPNRAERAAWLLNTWSNRPVPVINGGSGSDQHPTQAILDVYTLQRSFSELGGLDGKTILMCGDLKRGRTVRSLSYLMKNFEDIKIIYAAPKDFQMNEDVLKMLESSKIKYEIETSSLNNMLSEADAVYMTRIQDEHDSKKGDSQKIDISKFKLTLEDMKKIKPTAAILHPFPRRDEIDVAIDPDPRARYWRQERNGMWTRAALISYIFNVHKELLNY
jgi:aspartate carbamoyltransferase catalytic subunit